MDGLLLKYHREKAGKSKKHMADVIGKSENSYGKKERGEIKFSDEEKLAISEALHLDRGTFNAIFFDGNLP